MKQSLYTTHRLVYARSVLPQSMVFVGGDADSTVPIDFAIFLLSSAEKKILIDAGCDTMPGFDMHEFVSPTVALERIGVKAADITDVIITHAHHDHIDAVRHFANAVIHINKDEYVSGKRYIPAEFKVNTFDERLYLSDTLYVEKIGGHSVGSCVVHLVQRGEHYVFAGDECYSADCLLNRTPTGSSYDAAKSRLFVETYGAGYIVLLAHDEKIVRGVQNESNFSE